MTATISYPRAGKRLGSIAVLAVVVFLVAATPAAGAASAPPGTTGTNVTAQPSSASLGPTGSGGPDSIYPHDLHPNSSAPVNSTLGYFDGYWYNSSLNVTPSNGLNRTELQAFVDRTMARDELILDRNFETTVPVKIISRSSYNAEKKKARASSNPNSTYAKWNNDVWRATFIVGDNANVQQVLSGFYSGHVQGFYAPGPNRIDLITPNASAVYIDPATLAHELTHAMQDQYVNISRATYQGRTQDQQLAIKGVLEGQANYVKDVYQHECSAGGWSCLPHQRSGSAGSAAKGSGGTSAPPNYGVQWVLYFPYAMGPGYVHSLLQQGGWQAVDRALAHPPNSSATIISHRPVAPRRITVRRPAAGGWHRYRGVGVNGTDTPGEATIYAMFWWQSYRYNAGVVDPQHIVNGVGNPFDHYNYTSPASSGWTGGTVVPYRNPNASSDGYVWVTTWNSSGDARRFATAYRSILGAHGATNASNGTRSIPSSSNYAGTYRVTQNGTRVTIVEGPSPAAVDALTPSVSVGPPGSAPAVNATTNGSAQPAAGPGTSTRTPGFGVLVGVLAFGLVALGLALRRR